jgi:hypothetical protein
MKNAVTITSLVLALLLVIACTPTSTPKPSPVLTIDTPVMGLVGYQLSAKLDSSPVNAVYSSTDTDVSVTTSGLVTPLALTGNATITAAYQGVTATVSVPLIAVGLVRTWTTSSGEPPLTFTASAGNTGIVSWTYAGPMQSTAWYCDKGNLWGNASATQPCILSDGGIPATNWQLNFANVNGVFSFQIMQLNADGTPVLVSGALAPITYN